MHTLIYASTATGPFDRVEIGRILASSRARNADAGITGLLLYSDTSFLQRLEGEEDAVRAAFARIATDRRHTDIEVLVDEPTDRRRHPEWTMGFHHLDGFLVEPGLALDRARAEALLDLHPPTPGRRTRR